MPYLFFDDISIEPYIADVCVPILSDVLGNALKIILTPGQESDITQTKPLISDCSHSVIIADKGYDSDEFRDYIKQINCDPAIPVRKNRKNKPTLDKHLYGQRNVIGILIGLLTQYRRIFSKFDKNVLAFSSFIYFASALIWLR